MKHNAQYYLDLVKEYRSQNRNNRKYYHSSLANGWATIHHAGDNEIFYNLYEDGYARMDNARTGEILKHNVKIEELEGDDFEFASNILIYKSGYITFDSPENSGDKKYIAKLLTELYYHIGSMEPDCYDDKEGKYPVLCGTALFDENGIIRGGFSYYAMNGIEIHIHTIKEFVHENMTRKHFEMKQIPFIKSMASSNSVQVTFVDFSENSTDEVQVRRCNQALMELMQYIQTMLDGLEEKPEDVCHTDKNVPYGKATAKWVNTRQAKPLYTV